MNSETVVNNPYPEILKFCVWLKKEQERGLQFADTSLRRTQKEVCTLQRSLLIAQLLATEVEKLIDSGFDFSELEKACTGFNQTEEL